MATESCLSASCCVIAIDYIWEERNRNRVEQLLLDLMEAAREVLRRLRNYEEALEQKKMHLKTPPTYSKLDVIHFASDVAVHGKQTWLGIACINAFGLFVAAWSFPYVATAPEQGEMEGLVKAAELAREPQLRHLILVSDSMDLVQAIQSNSFNLYPCLSTTKLQISP